MSLRPLLLLVVPFLLLQATASAGTEQAEKRLHTAVDDCIAAADKASSNAALVSSLRPILTRAISFDAMTRRAVGPGWRQFTDGQKKEAVQQFTTLVIRNYGGKFTIGEHPVVTYKPATTTAPGRVEIPTTLLYKGSRYEVVYRLEESEGWLITDVVIEGVSMIANYRTQFDSQFKKGGADAVISSLNQAVTKP